MAIGAAVKIEHFISILEVEKRAPTPLESHYVLRAIAAYHQGFATLAEADIDRVIRASPPQILPEGYKHRSTDIAYPAMTTNQLRRQWEHHKRPAFSPDGEGG
jgi:hypothetical protein